MRPGVSGSFRSRGEDGTWRRVAFFRRVNLLEIVILFSDEPSLEESRPCVVALRRPHEHSRGGPCETSAGLDAGNAADVSPTVLCALSQRKDDEWTDAARRSATRAQIGRDGRALAEGAQHSQCGRNDA